MSDETLHALEEAIVAHARDQAEGDQNIMVVDWFVGYQESAFEPGEQKPVYRTAYATSEGTPNGAYGTGSIALDICHGHLLDDDDD